MKSESLVIVDQNATVNTFPAQATQPPLRHTMGVGCKEVGSLTFSGRTLTTLWFWRDRGEVVNKVALGEPGPITSLYEDIFTISVRQIDVLNS